MCAHAQVTSYSFSLRWHYPIKHAKFLTKFAIHYFHLHRHLHRCLHNRYHVACSVMTSADSKEKKDYLARSSVVEVKSLDYFLVLVFYSTKKREESCLLLVCSVQ